MVLVVTVTLVSLGVACSSAFGSQWGASQGPEAEAEARGISQSAPTPVPPANPTTPTELPAFPDISKHTVPLEEIYLDTF
jgi:hypothetical protein